MTLALIWAQARGGVIGRDGDIPWHIPEDMKFFRETTAGHPVIMGRRTWDSLPPRFRPLPGRRNIVVTRQRDWSADGATRVGSIDEACRSVPDGETAFVIGGGEIYAAAMDQADLLYVTEVDEAIDGDTRAPLIGADWNLDADEPWAVTAGGQRVRWLTYRR